MRLHTAWLILAMGTLVGCGEDLLDSEKPRRGPAMGVGGQLAPVDLQGDDKTKQAKNTPPPPPAGDSGSNVPPPPPPPPAADSSKTTDPIDPPPDPNVDRTAAKAGVSGKGQGYGSGPITTPLSVYFTFGERTVFEIQIPHAMKIYKAMHGNYPKTHDEFMAKIIKANSINLPEPRDPDARYLYLPEKAAKMSTYDHTDPPLVIEKPR